METIIYKDNEGKRGVYYDTNKFRNLRLYNNVGFYTIKSLSEQEIAEIEKATYEQVDKLLSKHIA